MTGNLNRSGKEIVKMKPFEEDDDKNWCFDSFQNHQDGATIWLPLTNVNNGLQSNKILQTSMLLLFHLQ